MGLASYLAARKVDTLETVSTMPRHTEPFRKVITGVTLFMLAGTCGATSFQSHESIRETAKAYLHEQAEARNAGKISVTIGQLDSRLRLQQCPEPLETFLPDGARLQGNTTVGVRCPTADGWRIFVTGKVSILADVLVLKTSARRGDSLHAGDVELVERDISALSRGYLEDPAELEGKILKRAVSTGMVLTPGLLEAPRVVRRGDRVTLEARQGTLAVRMQGEAVTDGRPGERIRVRSLNSEKIVEGTVVDAGVIKVTL
jgi:flagella basal body P-ring formation protein FlgA